MRHEVGIGVYHKIAFLQVILLDPKNAHKVDVYTVTQTARDHEIRYHFKNKRALAAEGEEQKLKVGWGWESERD